MSYYTLDAPTDGAKAAQWTYRTTLDACISAPRSRVIAVALYRHAKDHGYVDVFLAEWRSKRAAWLSDLTLRQRHWQDNTRRPSKARHHDSIAIRERYVRCS